MKGSVPSVPLPMAQRWALARHRNPKATIQEQVDAGYFTEAEAILYIEANFSSVLSQQRGSTYWIEAKKKDKNKTPRDKTPPISSAPIKPDFLNRKIDL